MSAFGVIQLTRQRVRESILKSLAEPCILCEGTGYIKSRDTITYEIIRELRHILDTKKAGKVKIIAHPEVIDNMKKKEGENLDKLSAERNAEISYHESESGAELRNFELIVEKQ